MESKNAKIATRRESGRQVNKVRQTVLAIKSSPFFSWLFRFMLTKFFLFFFLFNFKLETTKKNIICVVDGGFLSSLYENVKSDLREPSIKCWLEIIFFRHKF